MVEHEIRLPTSALDHIGHVNNAGVHHRGSTGPAEHLVRKTELPIWPPL